MSSAIIQVRDLGKRYRIGQRESYYALRDAITDALKGSLRLLHRTHKEKKENFFWALKDISFDVNQGEVLGIIGRNGAGKSTLLKILSRITEPTTGIAEIHGRVGSLLEVGTGFHSELTGRENIYLNGAILGMSRKEINQKFDEIVAFSEIEQFLDTPVKRYSSGMYVRLAFAVAAHLEPEILLVDEVLAVGDAQFQKKCLGKMSEVAEGGRTVLFVSHNMTAINVLCHRTILLDEGHVIRSGNTSDVVGEYLQIGSDRSGAVAWKSPETAPGDDILRLRSVTICRNGKASGEIQINEPVQIDVEFWILQDGKSNTAVNLYLLNDSGITILSTANVPSENSIEDEWYHQPHPKGLYKATCVLPSNFLNEGLHSLNIYLITLGPLQVHCTAEQVLSFNVFDTGEMREAGGGGYWAGTVRVRLPWKTERVENEC